MPLTAGAATERTLRPPFQNAFAAWGCSSMTNASTCEQSARGDKRTGRAVVSASFASPSGGQLPDYGSSFGEAGVLGRTILRGDVLVATFRVTITLRAARADYSAQELSFLDDGHTSAELFAEATCVGGCPENTTFVGDRIEIVNSATGPRSARGQTFTMRAGLVNESDPYRPYRTMTVEIKAGVRGDVSVGGRLPERAIGGITADVVVRRVVLDVQRKSRIER